MMSKKLIPILMLILLFFIILPLLPPGRFFTLDGLNVANIEPPKVTNPSFVLSGIFYLLNQFLSVQLLQKIIYIGILTYLLLGSYYSLPMHKISSKLIFAGIITFNPFVYSRFLSGQYLVILGYALFSQLMLVILSQPKNHRFLTVLLYLLLLFLTSIHFFFIALIFLLFYSLINARYLHSYKNIKALILIIIALIILVICSALILSNRENLQTLLSFNHQDLYAFVSTTDQQYGLLPNLLGLYGFWYEGEGQIVSLKNSLPFWLIITLFWLYFSILGFFKYLRNNYEKEKNSALILLSLVIIGIILSSAIKIKFLEPVIIFIYQSFPLLYILREPHKIIGVLAFFYAFFTAYYFEHQMLNWLKKLLLVIALGLIYYPGFITGFYQEIKLSDYPKEWEIAKKLLKTTSEKQVLIFPWHMYLPISFAYNKIIYNPAESYFPHTLSARNYEIPALETHENRIEGKHIEGLIKTSFKHNWSQALKAVNLKYIILLKEKDWQDYLFLEKESGIKKIFSGQTLDLFLIE